MGRRVGSAPGGRCTPGRATRTIRRRPRPPPNRRWHGSSLSRRQDAGGSTRPGERTSQRMPPQPRDQTGPEHVRGRRSERRISGRAQRKVAEEQAARRKRLTILGSAIGVALLIALVVFLIARPRQAGPPV